MANDSAPQPEILNAQENRLLFASSFSGAVYAKSILDTTGKSAQPVVSILTYPTEDYAGDRVRPDGGDWTQYPKHPYVNWNHRIPIGRGKVNHKALKHDGQICPVAVGETVFFEKAADVQGIDLRRRDPRTHRSWNREPPYTIDEVLRASSQAERLIRDDIATGVSIEFDVDETRKGKDFWDLSIQSLLENRPARHFENWRGLGYAHARAPVNPGCQTLAGQKAAASVEKAITIAQTGKLPGGEPLCEIILKSFLDLRDYRSPNMSVRVEGTPPSTEETPVVVKGDVSAGDSPATPESGSSSAESGAKMGAGHRALMNFVQGLHDICERVESEGGESDDLSIRKFVKKLCAKGKDLAGDAKARAEKHKAKLDKAGADDEDDDDPMDEDDYTPSTEEKAIETTADGAIITKAFPDWTPRRMTAADIVLVSPETPATPATPGEQGPVITKAERKALAAANKRLAKSFQGLSQLLDAAIANGKM